MPITIEKKASHRFTGSSENEVCIGDNTTDAPKCYSVAQPGFNPRLCFSPNDGEWYVIRNPVDQASFEEGTLIPLFGIAGATGVQGGTGVNGATGLQGPQGDTGIQGGTGVDGATGTQGVQGNTGIQGLVGSSGIQGIQGVSGLIGDTGLATKGDTGAQGLIGASGIAGLVGASGIQGSQGDTGVDGVTGNVGTTGVGSPTVFVSSEITGDGTAQSTPHGLGITPTKILASVTDNVADSQWTITEGAHTSTNVIITIDTGVKYKVLAIV